MRHLFTKMPLQRKKHPRFRKKESQDMKSKKNKVKKKQNILELLPYLPQDIKNIIYTMVMKDRIPIWKGLHEKNFSSTKVFLSMGLNPNYYYGYKYAQSNKFPIPMKVKKILNRNLNVKWSPHDIMLALDIEDWDEQPIIPDIKVTPLCSKQVKRESQNGIKSIKIEDNTCEKIKYREWTNVTGYYWYHETCRCIKCDRVRYIGRSKLSIKEAEKFQDIKWDNNSPQWNTKSILEKKYENNFIKIMIWSLLTDFWNEY